MKTIDGLPVSLIFSAPPTPHSSLFPLSTIKLSSRIHFSHLHFALTHHLLPSSTSSLSSETMGSVSLEKTVTGYAAHDASGFLIPYTYNLRQTGPEDVQIKVLYCGICHTDLHQTKNHLGMSKYPMVPGHEVVGEVVEVGSDVTRFQAGDTVGAGVIVGCCRNCGPCKANIEQYCNKRIWSYNDVYTDGKPTQGGFASAMVVDQKFLVKIPAGLAAEQAGPLLCAGLTVYSPLKHFGLMKSGLKGGILGLGGVGHMGVKIAKALGHHVTVISSSEKKKAEAMDHLGADAYLLSSDEAAMAAAAEELDYIIDTIPVFHPLEQYLSLLKVDGQIIMMGVINQPMQFIAPMIMLGRKSISGSFIGSMAETEEMLEFCEKNGLRSMIEVVRLDQINEAMERLERNDVRYRFVVDVAGSKLSA